MTSAAEYGCGIWPCFAGGYLRASPGIERLGPANRPGWINGEGAARNVVRSSKVAEVSYKAKNYLFATRMFAGCCHPWLSCARRRGSVVRKKFHSILFHLVDIGMGLGLIICTKSGRQWRVSVSVTDGNFHPIVHIRPGRLFPSNQQVVMLSC